MPIDFHNEKNRFTYASRQANQTWIETIKQIVEVSNKSVVDIGCGGGIYSKAFLEMGALHVTGVDFSEQILSSAKGNCKAYDNVTFKIGNALDTNLPNAQYEVILERALIHHIKDLTACFKEAYRLLNNGGTLIVQDRTPEDCLLNGSPTHIRGYFFSQFPHLIEKEVSRRYSSDVVQQTLKQVGFTTIEEHKLWETRQIYSNTEELANDLLHRTGRSILHELTDNQLQDLVTHITEQLQVVNGEHIVEQDRWTIWSATK